MVQNKEPTTYVKQLVALGRILQVLREEEDSEVLISSLINYLRAEADYSLIWVGLYDRLEHQLFGKGGVIPGKEAGFLRQRFVLNPGDLLEQVVIQQRPLAVADLRAELRAGEWRDIAQSLNIQGTIIFPIRHRDVCYGVVLLGTTLWGAAPRSEEKARLSIVLGAMAAALHHIEQAWQRQQIKHPDQPLFSLLNQLRTLTGLGARLEAIVEETHRFIQTSRTSVYWFEREQRYFWRRVTNRQKSAVPHDAHQPASGITAQEVNSFYQALLSDQLVSIGEAQSSLKADTTSRLMQLIRARSLLAAPILVKNELMGFLAVEGVEPRIWQEEEKNFLRGAAQLVALTTPLEMMEETIEQTKLDQALTAEIAHSIYSEDDWKATLEQTAVRISQRLKAERLVVLLHNPEVGNFDVCFQNYPGSRRPLPSALDGLNATDWMALEKSNEALSIENLESELRFLPWRDRLLDSSVRSLLLCSTSIGRSLEGVVLICHENPRSWSYTERDLVRVISQQVGLILHQWQLKKQTDQQEKISQNLQWGLQSMQQTRQLDRLEQSALQHIAQLLQVPLAVLVSWSSGSSSGRIVTSPVANDRFALNIETVVPLETDVLVNWALESDELISLEINEIPAETRQWLSAKGAGQVLAMALRTAPEHEPTGVLLIVDGPGRRWSQPHLRALGTLVGELAWCRRYLSLVTDLATHLEDVERLNWYKHSRLEALHSALLPFSKRFSELNNPKDPLFLTRYQQLVRQLEDVLNPIAQVLQQEQWQLQLHSQTVSLITLLKRALERVEELIKQRHLWSQVHDESNLTIAGDVVKIELVLYELLLCACLRSDTGGRIDIWCRQIDNRWLELSITDNGQMDPQLLSELENGRSLDLLTPSPLDHPPGLHLMICQTVMQQIGGECNFFKLDDGRNLSRLILPLASKPTASSASSFSPSAS